MTATRSHAEPVESPRRAAARLARQARAEKTQLADLALRLAGRPRSDERRVACELAVFEAEDNPRDAMNILEPLLEDRDASVRTGALRAASRISAEHFDRIHDLLVAWRDAPSSYLRRAAVAAAARSAQAHRLERAPHLTRFVRPLLGDADPAVRRSLVGSALPALLRAYPEATFEALIECSTSSDPRVLRDVAASFASPAAAPLAKRALIVLRKLALDERRPVWRAAASAMWRLGRRRPDVVRPELDRWLEDDSRAAAAREALRYL